MILSSVIKIESNAVTTTGNNGNTISNADVVLLTATTNGKTFDLLNADNSVKYSGISMPNNDSFLIHKDADEKLRWDGTGMNATKVRLVNALSAL